MDLSDSPAQNFFQDNLLQYYARPIYPVNFPPSTSIPMDKMNRRLSFDMQNGSVAYRKKPSDSSALLNSFPGTPSSGHRSLIIPHSHTLHQFPATPLTRPINSCPNLTDTKTVTDNVVTEFQRGKMELLRQTGNLIDLGGPPPSTKSSLKADLHFFDPLLRPLSESSESSSGGSPFVNEGSFHNWETFDDNDDSWIRRRVSREVPDEAFSDKAVALSIPDIPQDRRSPKPTFDAANQKLAVLQVKAECESLRSFYRMVYRLHNDFQYDDELTNIGFIRSPMVEEFQRTLTGSIGLVVLHNATESVTTFNCDVQTTVEHAISHVLFEIKGDQASLMQMNRYIFRIHGRMDCLSGESPLSDYQQVHLCCKNGTPLKVGVFLS